MSLPIVDDDRLEQVFYDRPGDELYPEIKEHIEYVINEEKEAREKLVALIKSDLVLDEAIANSCDTTGKILTYLAQQREIEPPEFIGDVLMRNFSRISKLKLSLDYAKLIGLEGNVLDLCIKAEIERLWGDTNTALLKNLFINKAAEQKQQQQPVAETGVKVKK